MAAANGKILETVISIGGKLDPSVASAINKAEIQLKHFSDGFVGMEKKALAAGAAAAAAFGALAVKIGKDSVSAAMDFEKQMSNVATLLDGDVKKRIGELGDELLEMSKRTGAGTADLTDGLYNVISALGDSADSLKILETASKAAKAGNATTTESINLLSAVMKGYGNTSAEFAKSVADMSFQVVKLGQTTFPELASSMGGVVPLANTMGMKIEEVNGYMATLTGVTGGASEVATQMQAALTALLKPSKNMTAAMKKLGFSNGQAMIKAYGLQKSLLALKKTTKDDIEFGNLFGRKEGITFALAATGSQAENVAKKTKAMYESAGAAEAAFAAQTNNLQSKINAINNKFSIAAIQIGQKFIPPLTALAEKLAPRIERFLTAAVASIGKLIDSMKRFDFARLKKYLDDAVSTFRTLADFVQRNKKHFLTLGKAVLSLVAAFHAVQAATAIFSAISAAAALVASPIFLTIGALAALVTAAWFVYDNFDEVCAYCSAAWTRFTLLVSDTWAAFADKFPATSRVLTGAWRVMTAAISEAWTWTTDQLSAAMEPTADFLSAAWEKISAGAKIAGKVIAHVWTGLTGALRLEIEGVSSLILGVFHAWPEIMAAATALMSGNWDGFCKHFTDAAAVIKADFLNVWREMEAFVKKVMEHIMSFIDPLIDKIDGLRAFLQSAGENISGAVSAARKITGFAAGGFTSGPALCGEAGTEAVISFDPRYRAENRAYLATAAEMLGMTAAPAPAPVAGSVTNLGGITFAPVINGGGNTQDVISQLRAAMPQLVDMLEDALAERQSHRYA